MTALKLSMVLAPLVLADVGWWRNGAYVGPVKDVNCLIDGGLTCVRDGGTAMGQLSCTPASSTETGCVTPGTQSFNGNKTHNGDQRIVGHTHAGLTACAAGTKGNWQTCTTHNAPVFCNGTTNIELTGSSSLITIASVNVDRLAHAFSGYLAAFTLPYDYTVTSVTGIIGSSAAGTTINVQLSDGTNICTAAITCTTGAIAAPAGNCTFAANSMVTVGFASDGCTTPITVYEDLQIAGYRL